MGKAPDSSSHFKIYKPVFRELVEIVLLFRPCWEEGEWHLHVLVSIKGGCQVEILDVEAHVLRAFGAEDTVPHQFRCGEVCCSRRELARVVDEVSSGSDANAMWISLLRTKISDDSSVRDSAMRG